MRSVAITADNVQPETLFSMDALRRSWRLVRKNGQSPGTDRVTPARFEHNLSQELQQLRQDLVTGTYRPQPVQRFYQLKSSGKRRPLTIWAVRDRVAQRVVLDYLTPRFEDLFLECSFGFRPGRRIADAINAVVAARQQNLRWVVDADIAECFDSIPTNMMEAQVLKVVPVPSVTGLISLWLNAPVAGRSRARAAVSQGGVISPLLTNLYLHRFDQTIVAAFPETRMVRFADDFVILCRRRQEAVGVLSVARQALTGLEMRVNEAKTRIVHFDEGFTFLGVTFKGSQRGPLPGGLLEHED